MAEDREGFVARWSRRKLAQDERPEPAEAGDERLAAAIAPAVPADPATAADPEPAQPDAAALDLPDIEQLTAESDFTPFLRDGVPEDLQRLALRKLWRLTPGVRDGLDDYDEDFSLIGTVAEKISTLFKPGRGMQTPEEAEAESFSAARADEDSRRREVAGDAASKDGGHDADDGQVPRPVDQTEANHAEEPVGDADGDDV